jgi:hypothetical protein
MADTLEKRITDLEEMVASFPDILDIRVTAVQARIAEIRETLALHTARFTRIETRLGEVERRIEGRLGVMDGKLNEILARLPPQG